MIKTEISSHTFYWTNTYTHTHNQPHIWLHQFRLIVNWKMKKEEDKSKPSWLTVWLYLYTYKIELKLIQKQNVKCHSSVSHFLFSNSCGHRLTGFCVNKIHSSSSSSRSILPSVHNIFWFRLNNTRFRRNIISTHICVYQKYTHTYTAIPILKQSTSKKQKSKKEAKKNFFFFFLHFISELCVTRKRKKWREK